MSRRWLARPAPGLESACTPGDGPGGLPEALVRLLARRGFEGGRADSFLRPGPGDLSPWRELPGAEEAVREIAGAIRSGRRILVWGDYDVDGLTAAVIMHNAIGAAGGLSTVHIPDRMEDGYGMGSRAPGICRERGAGMLVTVDCGTSSTAEVDALASAGIGTVITDHHEASGDMPRAAALVNPCLHRPGRPWSALSGAGTAFMVARGLAEAAGSDAGLEEAAALACLGTVCDVVPLFGDNRTISRYGLQNLRAGASPGMTALASVAGFDISETQGSDISFRLGPRLNSCGRVSSPDLALGLLMSASTGEGYEKARRMEAINEERKLLDRKVAREALASAPRGRAAGALLLASPDWHRGVVGIAASRLASELGIPVVLASVDREGVARGSARGVPGLNLCEVLGSMRDLLLSFGGHAGAAGLSFRAERTDDLAERFAAEVSSRMDAVPDRDAVMLDGRLEPDEITPGLVEALSAFEPFGEGNEEPVWITTGATLSDWGTVGGGRHARCSFDLAGRRLSAIGFGMGAHQLPPAGPLDIAYCLRMDEFRGRRELKLHLRDVRPARNTGGRPG
jgi:single-stranded-DNA-specific exonuclease